MQDAKQIQKDIENIKLQLNVVEVAALSAPAEEKEYWSKKSQALTARLEELEKALAENVTFDGVDSIPIIDDTESATGADAVITPAPQSSHIDQSEGIMADAMIERILSADESQMPDGSFGARPETEKAEENAATADVMADAMIDNILATNEVSDIDDATADAMLDSILSAIDMQQQEQSSSSEPSDTVITPTVGNDPDPIIMAGGGDPVTVPPEQNNAESVFVMPTETAVAPEPETVIPVGAEPDMPVPSDFGVQETPAEPQSAVQPHAPHNESVTPDDYIATHADSQTALSIEKLKLEAEDANRRAQAALAEAEKIKAEAVQIKLAAETERAMYAAEMELQRGLRAEEDNMRCAAEQAEKDKLAEKIARRKAEIAAIRNGLQDVKDTDSAFVLREKLFSVQLVLDDDERNSPEISYLLTKSMDDISHALEVAELKRRIAVLTAAKTPAKVAPAKTSPAKKTAAKKKKPAKKAAAKKKRPVAAAKRSAPIRAARPPARRRYAPRPNPYAPRYYR